MPPRHDCNRNPESHQEVHCMQTLESVIGPEGPILLHTLSSSCTGSKEFCNDQLRCVSSKNTPHTSAKFSTAARHATPTHFVPCRHHRASRSISRPVGNVVLKTGRQTYRTTVQKEVCMRWVVHAETAPAARLSDLKWS